MRESLQVKTVLINLSTALILALLLELIFGLGLMHPEFIPDILVPHYSKFYESEDRDILQVTPCAEYDSEFFYRFKPGTCRFKNREFDVINSFNSLGLRDDEESLDNPAILIFGDSFTMGWGVSQSEAYPQQLEALCGQKILNAGVSSFGTAREMKLLKKMDLKNVGTVIIQYHSNDFEENAICIENDFILPIRSEESYNQTKEMISDRNRYFPFKYMAGISKAVARSIIFPEVKKTFDTLEAKAFLDILLQARLGEIASRVFVFKIDDVNNDDGFVNAVDHLLADRKYEQLHLTTIHIKNLLNKKDFFLLDTHIRETGHKKLAGTLYGYLNKNREYPVLAGVSPDDGNAGNKPAASTNQAPDGVGVSKWTDVDPVLR